MPKLLTEQRVFFREFRRNFRATGALLPSGKRLAMALTRFITPYGPPKAILEAGPGTGAVTRRILESCGPLDRLDLVEANAAFVNRLKHRFATNRLFRTAAPRCRVIHDKVENLPHEPSYDVIVSGLPLNNFEPDDVDLILGAYERLIKPGGIVSFFEYTAVREAKALVSNPRERLRLKEVSRVLRRWLTNHELRRDLVLANIPPAWVHHVRPFR
jgi:phosphatidylethanolamine/phosphatidyl-N-methylethanolamine N-methyltransferase